MPLASLRRLLPRALAVASLICTGLVLPGAIPTAAAATCATTNIAQGKTATASSTENASFPASNAVDGNTGTRWSSAFSDPQWLEVDLGSSQSICQVTLQWETAYGKAFQIQTSTDNSTWTTIYSTTTGTGGTQNLAVTGTGRYIRMYGTARATQYGYSLWEFQVFGPSSGGGGTGCTGQSNTPNFGPNVYVFDPSMSSSSIQTTLNNVFNTQKLNQFGTQRYALLFKPGTYSAEANIGYYTSIQGLGQNPDDVTINGDVTVDAFDGTGNATQNFWRSAENLAINPSAGSDRWAVAQAGPFRRVDVHGGLELYPASYGYASGGYIADTKVSGQVSSVSQQQWYSADSNFGSWSGSVWNMVFSGVTGAPAQSFPSPPMTTLATTPTARDVPYLYVDSSGNYHVFLPSLRTNASGASWASGSTPGTSLPMSQFFVATPSNTAAQINAALAQGCNLFFTPGVYNINQTINVTNPNTVVLGVGFPTLIPQNGVNTMQVADVDGVRIDGLLFDAGTTNSSALLTVGTRARPRATRATRSRCRTPSSASAVTSPARPPTAWSSTPITPWSTTSGPGAPTTATRARSAGPSTPPRTAWSSTAPTCWRPACSSSTTRTTTCSGTATAARPSSSRTRCRTTRRTRPPG